MEININPRIRIHGLHCIVFIGTDNVELTRQPDAVAIHIKASYPKIGLIDENLSQHILVRDGGINQKGKVDNYAAVPVTQYTVHIVITTQRQHLIQKCHLIVNVIAL